MSLRQSNLRILLCVFSIAAAVPVLAAPALANPVGQQTRISFAGPPGDLVFQAKNPAAAYDTREDRHLVVWHLDNALTSTGVYGRFVGANGEPVGEQFEIVNAGTLDNSRSATDPRIVYNPREREFLVVWSADRTSDNDYEIWGQRVSATGGLVAPAFQISSMGDATAAAYHPQVVFNSADEEYVVVWHSNLGGDHVWGRRLSASGEALDVQRQLSATSVGAWPTIAYNSNNKHEYLLAFQGRSAEHPDARVYVHRLMRDLTRATPSAAAHPQGLIQTAGHGHKPAVVYNPKLDEYVVAWPEAINNDTEVRVQRLVPSGAEKGSDDVQISQMGPVDQKEYGAGVDVAIGYSTTSRRYVVTWTGDDSSRGFVRDEWEVFGQSLDETLNEVGSDDVPVSRMGPTGSIDFGVGFGSPGREVLTGPMAWNSAADRFLIVYNGDDDTLPLVNDEREVFARRFEPFKPPPPPEEPEAPQLPVTPIVTPPIDPPPGPEPPLAPKGPVCLDVKIPDRDRDGDGCVDPTPLTPSFQVAFRFKGKRIKGLVVRKAPKRGTVVVVCKRGCAGRKGKALARREAPAAGGTIRIALKHVRVRRKVKLEVQLGQSGLVRRFLEYRLKPRVPALKLMEEGCLMPASPTRVECPA